MKSRRWHLFAAAGALAAAGLAVAGCGSSGDAANASSSISASRASNPTLVVYSAQGYDKAMVAAFEKKYPNIPATLNDNSTGPLLTQIEAERNNPKWGLLWVDGATAFAGLDTQGLLSRNWTPNVSWNSLGTSVLPANKSFIPTGVTLVPGIAYSASRVAAPAGLNSLLSPSLKGKVGMNDPSQSGPTFPLIAGIMNYLGHGNVAAGEAAGKSYFLRLKANGLVIHQTNGPTLGALDAGQINVALVQSSAAVGDALANPTHKVAYILPATLLPSAIGIDQQAPATVQAEARTFANFVLSPAGQAVMKTGDPTGDSLYYPVVAGVTMNKALPSLANVATQTIDPYAWGPLEPSINAWFTADIVH